MTNSTYLEEDEAKQGFYPVLPNYCWSCYEESSSQCRYILASSKNCGLLMLINQLLSEEDREIKQRQRNLLLAEKLIHNFHKTTVRIHYTHPGDVIDFIEKMILKAEEIVTTENAYNVIVTMYARRFVNILGTSHSVPDSACAVLERSWDDFVIAFLQERLQCLRH